LSNLPSIPPNRDKNTTIDKLKELAEIWKGERGNKLDRVVTFRDMVKVGLGAISRSGNLTQGSGLTQVPTYTSVLTNLTANGGLNAVFLNWDGEDQANYSYTEVYRHTEDNLANAVFVATAVASLFVDNAVVSGQEYFYWVRAVSTTGNKTDFNATAGTSATVAFEPAYIIDLLNGQISESELAAELLSPISSIPGIQATLDSHGIRLPTVEGYVDQLNIDVPNLQTLVADFGSRIPLLETDSAAHSAHLTSLDDSVAAFRNIPAFDASKDYAVDDLARYGGVTWKALTAMSAPSPTPSEGANWTNIGSFVTYDGVLSADAQAISDSESRITVAEGAITGHASDIDALQTSVNSANTNITANANAVNALDTRVTATETQVTSQASSITAIEASLNDIVVSEFSTSEVYAIDDVFRYNSDYYKVIATQSQPNATPPNATYYEVSPDYSSLQGTVSANSAAIGALDTRVTSAEGTVTAHGTRLDVVEADLSTAEGDIAANTTATDALESRVTSTEGTLSAHTNSLTALNISVTANEDDIASTNTALTNLTSRVTVNEDGLVSTASDIATLTTNLANAEGDISANSTSISDLNTTVSNQGGTITAHGNSIALLESDIVDLEGADAAAATALNNLTTRVTANEGDISSQATDISSINSSINAINGDILGVNGLISANSTAIGLLDSRVQTAEGTITAQASDISQLRTDLDVLDVNGNATAISELTTRVTATEDDIQAVGLSLTQINSDIDGNTAAIQSKAETSVVTSIDGEVQSILAQSTLKLDVNGRVSGIGLMNDGATSEFIVASDAVYFIDPGQSVTPFVPGQDYASLDAARNTQLVFGYAKVEGQSRFVINAPAYIQDGAITTAQISNAMINQAQIDELIVSGAEIADGAITNAKISGVIYSNNYIQGYQGWAIDKSGAAEFSNIIVYDDGEPIFRTGSSLPVASQLSILNSDPSGEIATSGPDELGNYRDAGDENGVNSAAWYVSTRRTSITTDGNKLICLTPNDNYLSNVITTAVPVFDGMKLKIKLRIRYTDQAKAPSISNIRMLRLRESELPNMDSTDDKFIINPNLPSSHTAYSKCRAVNNVTTIATIFHPSDSSITEFQDYEFDYEIPFGLSLVHASFEYYGGSSPYGSEFEIEHFSIEPRVGALAELDEVSTTFIADAAITEAKIAEAAVGTLKIDENAVTVMQIAEFSDITTGSGSWVSIGDFVFDHGHSEEVLTKFEFSATVKLNTTSWPRDGTIQLRMEVDGQNNDSEIVDVFSMGGGDVFAGFWQVNSSNLMRVISTQTIPPGPILVELFIRESSSIGFRSYGAVATATAVKR
jgi:predicted  nucleic acid-binding Zn-ribbon protein